MDDLLIWVHRIFSIDPLALACLAAGLGLVLWARRRLDGALTAASGQASRGWATGAEAAAEILRATGLEGVAIESSRGPFADYYDPASQTIRLSEASFEGHSLAAVGVAAFEAGHALQHARRDPPMPLLVRDGLAQFARLAPAALGLAMAVGFLLDVPPLTHAAMAAFPLAVALPLLALPIERDAARRAARALAMTARVGSDQEETLHRALDALALRLVDAALPRLRKPAWIVARPPSSLGP